jgi:hypothetical protein
MLPPELRGATTRIVDIYDPLCHGMAIQRSRPINARLGMLDPHQRSAAPDFL